MQQCENGNNPIEDHQHGLIEIFDEDDGRTFVRLLFIMFLDVHLRLVDPLAEPDGPVFWLGIGSPAATIQAQTDLDRILFEEDIHMRFHDGLTTDRDKVHGICMAVMNWKTSGHSVDGIGEGYVVTGSQAVGELGDDGRFATFLEIFEFVGVHPIPHAIDKHAVPLYVHHMSRKVLFLGQTDFTTFVLIFLQ